MTLEALNGLDKGALRAVLSGCCGSQAWVRGMEDVFPVRDVPGLLAAASRIWRACAPKDWLEAFDHHPRIGDREALRKKYAGTGASAEQAGALDASVKVLEALAEGNRAYEEKFGYIFIVCATGKSASEMLGLLRTRLGNDPAKELVIAMSEQEKITELRLKKLLS
ncbi:2-oxo-4-hydroxy-4-carboxy-5-ureidoimidazoline decarboxylase [Flavitalea sp. BT771]|uniref:2-oxo-4-hydroxy-4-carboxy-5-ureidoimidazoline decarboxylase n=1 Tax=Flavitalea sp. BT771 TaxID=3063329 RepID=UPI0026E42F0E|nr:2-oxo-4-hydroxy-4-carboxy-5-ureidoimidazoline decarboxylase [Flavitalea sp. BT771]MDO6431903.1 2-oxo-4-hydroxy-4-carboxy-5-ureidoimidazoline decarboxylase [Flavitalea sp. BT771]MDV6220812.1 2-oxo-4-hydroxy-4-carboxy-5-ureidoimidazoline decarboxylase [Flavitalea sp. BT771]